MRKETPTILLFLALTTLFSAIFWVLLIRAGHHPVGRYIDGLMWCPGTAAILTVALRGLPAGSLGFRWGGARYAWLAYLTPLAYAAIGYGLVWGLGLGGFPDTAAIKAIDTRLGWTVADPLVFVPVYFLLNATAGMVTSVATALGEELGWRGLLVPQMNAKFGFTGTGILVGLIWAAWHLPVILFADYNGGTPIWFSLPCFVVFVVAVSVMLTWFRLKSNSVWPCAILHASHNLFIQVFFSPLTTAHGTVTAYAIGEFGFAVPAVAALFAVGFWMARPKVGDTARAN